MLNNLPDELLLIIYNYLIHPYNNNYYKLQYIHKNTLLNEIGRKKMICSYCNKKIINGIYSKNKPICNKHLIQCSYCLLKCDIYDYSFLKGKCNLCTNYVIKI